MGGKVNFEGLKIGAWGRFFEESGRDIFEVIEWGIKVATWCHSQEFFARRDCISEILHSVTNPTQRLSLVRDLFNDSGSEREEEEKEEEDRKKEKEESGRREWEDDIQKQEKEENRQQEWEEDGQKQEKEEIGPQKWKEAVSLPATAGDSGCRRRVIKMNQAPTATKRVGLPAAEEGTKVTGTTCNDQKLKGKPSYTIVEGGAVRRKPKSDYSVPKKGLKPVCMSEEYVKMKTEAIKKKLRQRYLEAEQARKRRIQRYLESEQANKRRKSQANLKVTRGFR